MNENQNAAEQSKEKNFIAKWIGTYFSPSETFASIDRKPDWVLPLLLMAVVTAVSLHFMAPAIEQAQIQAIMERQDMTRQEAVETMEQAPAVFRSLTPIFGAISFLIVSFILAGIFFVVYSYVLGGESTYKKVLSVYSYVAFAVGIVATIVRVPLVMAKGTVNVQTSLAAFLSPESEGQIFYNILAKFDIFVIWQVILWIIGFGIIYKFSRGKSAAAVLSLWGIYILLSVVLGSIFGGLGT